MHPRSERRWNPDLVPNERSVAGKKPAVPETITVRMRLPTTSGESVDGTPQALSRPWSPSRPLV
jgi:hypothetical protein